MFPEYIMSVKQRFSDIHRTLCFTIIISSSRISNSLCNTLCRHTSSLYNILLNKLKHLYILLNCLKVTHIYFFSNLHLSHPSLSTIFSRHHRIKEDITLILGHCHRISYTYLLIHKHSV